MESMRAWLFGFAVVTVIAFGLKNYAVAASSEDLFKSSDVNLGKQLHKENRCSECHQARSGLNEHDYYTRPGRIVGNQAKLVSQISYCSTQLNLSFFPEDELSIAAFLNDAYYKLKQ